MAEQKLRRVLVDEGTIVAGASSFVDSQRWVECQVTVSPGYRRRGYGTRVAASYVHACVRDGKRVPWDASGTASVRLAKRIGYREVREYPVLSVLPFPD